MPQAKVFTYPHRAPRWVFDDSSYCYCGLQKADLTDTNAVTISDNIVSLIHESVKQGKILPVIDR